MMARLHRLPLVAASAFCAILCMPLAAGAQAQPESYPSRPITIVVPFPAGGLTDVPARLAATMLQEKLGVGVVIENQDRRVRRGRRGLCRARNAGRLYAVRQFARRHAEPALPAGELQSGG